MKTLIEVLNHPAVAFGKKNRVISWCMVIFTIMINGFLEPLLQHFSSTGVSNFNFIWKVRLIGLGILSYVLLCFFFWLVCKCLGSKTSLIDHISTWGLTFAPTAVCAVVVTFTEVFFYIFWNSIFWGIILNIVFGTILIWKAILFFIYLTEFAHLKGWRFFVACFVIGGIILFMAVGNGAVGLKTPVL